MTNSFVRGSAITFRAACKDDAGAPITPDSATLYVSYIDAATGCRLWREVPMTVDDDQVSAVWDSSVASDAMPVTWHIRASGVASDGTFTLSAGEANPTR